MASISVENTSFTATIYGNELRNKKSFRTRICSVLFPSPLNSAYLGVDYSPGRLGYIDVNKTESLKNYVMASYSGGDSGTVEQGGAGVAGVNVDTSESFSVLNSLTVRLEVSDPSDGGGDFDPCQLDYDKDGVVSQEDVDTIYSKIPFINDKYDINGDDIVDEKDYRLAIEYIGSFCGDDVINDGPPPPPPVLDLDCFTYQFGDVVWADQSGNGYDFNLYQGNYYALPIKNDDGGITLGRGAFIDGDASSTTRYFSRQCATYEEGTAFIAANIEAGTASLDGLTKDKYIPGVDEDFSFEFVFRYTPNLHHGRDRNGEFGTGEGAGYARAKFFGYPSWGEGGYNFGTSYLSTGYQDANFPNQFVPYRNVSPEVFGGIYSGVSGNYGGDPGTPSQPVSSYYGARYDGGILSFGGFLNLDPTGLPTTDEKYIVQYVHSASRQSARLYVNGVLVRVKTSNVGIGLPEKNDEFRVGSNIQGGWSSPDGIDVYTLKVYDEFLTQKQITTRYAQLRQKYGY